MLSLNKVHHIAIICSNYEKFKHFYTAILGLEIKNEVYRKERESYKLDLTLNGIYIIELFSFPNPPSRLSQPEAMGLRHLAFEVDNVSTSVKSLKTKGIQVEDIRIDTITGKQFTFFEDPDGLPIEIYQK